MRAASGRLLASAALMPGCEALELRYVVQPMLGDARVRMYITAKGRGWHKEVTRAAAEAACAALPQGLRGPSPSAGRPSGTLATRSPY